jgi:hypothetical protein
MLESENAETLPSLAVFCNVFGVGIIGVGIDFGSATTAVIEGASLVFLAIEEASIEVVITSIFPIFPMK